MYRNLEEDRKPEMKAAQTMSQVECTCTCQKSTEQGNEAEPEGGPCLVLPPHEKQFRHQAMKGKGFLLSGRRQPGDHLRENQVHEQKRGGNPDGGKLADLGQERKTAELKGCKSTDRGQGRQQSHRPDFFCSLPAGAAFGSIQKEKIGDAMVDGNGDDGAAETDGQDRNRWMPE